MRREFGILRHLADPEDLATGRAMYSRGHRPGRNPYLELPGSPDEPWRKLRRLAARLSGLAFCLAFAVRPGEAAEVSGAQRWVPKIGFCGAVRNDLRDALTREGPLRTVRGVPALIAVTFCPAIGAPDTSMTAWFCSCCAGRGRRGEGRLRPVAGKPCAAAARARRATARRARAKLPLAVLAAAVPHPCQNGVVPLL